MHGDEVPGDSNKEDEGEEEQERNQEEAARLTKNMNVATAKLNLSSLDLEQEQDEDKEFNNLIDKEDSINLLSDNEGGKDFLEEDLSVHHKDLTLFGDDNNTSLEVSSGVFDAVHSNKSKEPDDFKKLIWNKAGPSPRNMIILLGLLKDELEADQAGLPAKFNRVPTKLLEFLVQEAGEDHKDQINFIKQIMEELELIGQTNCRNKALSLDKRIGQSEASKTQGTLPGAHKASLTEEVAIELPPWQDGTRRERILITGDNPPLVLQSMEGEHHHLQLTLPLTPQDKEEQQSKQSLAEMTLLYSGQLNNQGSLLGNLCVRRLKECQ
jgi:hypothetical protein